MSDEPDLAGGDAEPPDEELAERLASQRPVPSAGFRGSLGRRLAARDPGYGHRPARLWAIVGAYSASGAVLVALGVLQATGKL